MSKNIVMIEFGCLKINGFDISYKELSNLNYHECNLNMTIETFEMFKKFADYMIDRTKDLNPDIYNPIYPIWPMNTEGYGGESFDPDLYDNILNMLKENVEYCINKKADDIIIRSRKM